MKRKMMAVITAGLVIAGGGLAATPANAACAPTLSKSTSMTTVRNAGCTTVAAGIWRYVGTAPVHYTSAWSGTVAQATSTNGSNAGHDYRTALGTVTTGWIVF